MAGNTSLRAALPEAASSRAQTLAAASTETKPATAASANFGAVGAERCSALATAQAVQGAAMPIVSIFAPQVAQAPSPNSTACAASTTPITSVAAQGPSRIAAAAAPTRCPDVPWSTGKLIIWAAKMAAPARASDRQLPVLIAQAHLPQAGAVTGRRSQRGGRANRIAQITVGDMHRCLPRWEQSEKFSPLRRAAAWPVCRATGRTLGAEINITHPADSGKPSPSPTRHPAWPRDGALNVCLAAAAALRLP